MTFHESRVYCAAMQSSLFRGCPAKLPRNLRPLLRPQTAHRSPLGRRWNSRSAGVKATPESSSIRAASQATFWTTGRVLLVSALASGAAYAYASSGVGSVTADSTREPQYGSLQDMEKVRVLHYDLLSTPGRPYFANAHFCRPLRSCAPS